MTRPVSVGRFSRIGALGMFGSLLLSLVVFGGCPGTLDPGQFPPGGAGGMAGTGGGGTGGTGGGAPMLGCAMAPQIFTDKGCIGCHGGTAVIALGGGFDMEKAGWQMALIDMGPKSDAPAMNKCKDMNQIYLKKGAGDVAEGLFISKLKAAPPCGVQMPQVGAKLTAAEVTCIQNWANDIVTGGDGL